MSRRKKISEKEVCDGLRRLAFGEITDAVTYGRRQEAFSANSPGLQSRPNAYAPGPPQDIRWRNFLPPT